MRAAHAPQAALSRRVQPGRDAASRPARVARARDGSARPRRSEGVLAAARELFFEGGYRATTVAQIAKRAGYSKRTVYLDYLNKDELFFAVCAEGGERLLADLRAISADELTVAECMDRYLDVYVAFCFDERPYFRMIFAETTPAMIANCSPQMQARVRELEGGCLGLVADWARRAIGQSLLGPVDPWDVVVMVVGAATGMLMLSQAGSQTAFSRRGGEELTRLVVETLWRGLRGPAPLSPRLRSQPTAHAGASHVRDGERPSRGRSPSSAPKRTKEPPPGTPAAARPPRSAAQRRVKVRRQGTPCAEGTA